VPRRWVVVVGIHRGGVDRLFGRVFIKGGKQMQVRMIKHDDKLGREQRLCQGIQRRSMVDELLTRWHRKEKKQACYQRQNESLPTRQLQPQCMNRVRGPFTTVSDARIACPIQPKTTINGRNVPCAHLFQRRVFLEDVPHRVGRARKDHAIHIHEACDWMNEEMN